MTKKQARRKLQRAEDAYHNHIYNERGMMRAVLAHEKAYFEKRKAQLKADIESARTLYNFL